MTKKYLYKKLDAFTSGQSTGNPAACVYLKGDQILSEDSMQDIARKHKGFVSEVIYCSPINPDTYKLRYYSSECEVDFCGHGTIACMYHLLQGNEDLKQFEVLKINTLKGDLLVYNELQALDAVFITAPTPEYFPVTISKSSIADNLNMLESSIDSKHSIDIINAGLKTLIVPIVNLNTIVSLVPNESTLKDFCLKNEIDIILVFTTDVTNKSNKLRTRVFAPKFGYLEDSATGSGNSALGYYMLKYNMWNGKPISIEQNGERETYNVVQLKVLEEKVLFGGRATVVIDGHYLHDK